MSAAVAAALPGAAQFLPMFEREHTTTMKVLQAVPGGRLDFRPHERSYSAGELAWHLAYSPLGLANAIAAGRFDAYQQPPAPATLEEILRGAGTCYEEMRRVVAGLTPQQLGGAIPLPGGRHVPAQGLLWTILFHQIHHRGQLSVYIRMMGGKVPAIYGP